MKYEITALRLREALSNKNMRPQDLSNASGVGKASISQYLNGTHAPSNISSGKMAKVLGVSAPWLMGYDVDSTPAATFQASVSPLEQELLDNFHRLNNEGQNDLVKYSKLLVNSGDYEKDVALSS